MTEQNRPLTTKEKLIRDIDNLRESIRLNRVGLASGQWSENDRAEIRGQLNLCLQELQMLLEEGFANPK
jgi:enamine deaminase RidA (YjgF/YER057c/UK114 family)